jgi:hypothetical protein
MPDWIEYWVLTTGDTRRSARDEVRDEGVTECRALIERAIEGEEDGVWVPAAQIDGQIAVISTTGSLLVKVTHDEVPLVTVGIATRSIAGASLWRVLTQMGKPQIHPNIRECPVEPWCAVRFEPGLEHASRKLEIALVDFWHCLAWAFIERVQQMH